MESLGKGKSVPEAARYYEVPERSVYNWLNKRREREDPQEKGIFRRIRTSEERSAGAAGGVVTLEQLCRAIEVSRQSYYAHIQSGEKRELLESLIVDFVKRIRHVLDRKVKHAKPIILHSDRGSEYCCHDLIEYLKKNSIISSMTDADHCAQNALAERMNGIIKQEFIPQDGFDDEDTARKSIEHSINLYNTVRPHSSLAMRVPDEVHNEDYDRYGRSLISSHCNVHFGLPTNGDGRSGVRLVAHLERHRQ